jgi:hypothetical protein
MNDNYNKIDEEELERIEEELLEEEAEREEEKMKVEGRSVFEIEKMKRERSRNNQDSKKSDLGSSLGRDGQ